MYAVQLADGLETSPEGNMYFIKSACYGFHQKDATSVEGLWDLRREKLYVGYPYELLGLLRAMDS